VVKGFFVFSCLPDTRVFYEMPMADASRSRRVWRVLTHLEHLHTDGFIGVDVGVTRHPVAVAPRRPVGPRRLLVLRCATQYISGHADMYSVEQVFRPSTKA